MKPIKPFHAVAAALLCATSLCAEATEPDRTLTTPPDSPVLVAASTENFTPRAARAGAGPSWNPGERGARAAAIKGPDALRRYIDRTRMIYALRFEDFAIDR